MTVLAWAVKDICLPMSFRCAQDFVLVTYTCTHTHFCCCFFFLLVTVHASFRGPGVEEEMVFLQMDLAIDFAFVFLSLLNTAKKANLVE